MMNGGGWWMAGGGLLFVVLLGVVVALLFARGSEPPRDRTLPARPEEILRERLARGDITEEDYRARLDTLRL